MTWVLRTIMILMVLSIVPLVHVFRLSDDPQVMLPLVGVLVGMFAIVLLIAWVNRANWGTSIMLDGRTLTLRDYTGRLSRCAIREVRFDDTAIATRDAVVILGRPQARIYNRTEIEQRLIPRLGDAQRIGPIAMLKLQIELRHPQGLVAVIAMIGVLVYAAVTIAT